MLDGTKKLFPTEYENFKKAMIAAAESGDLPVGLEFINVEKFTLKEFEDAFSEFEKDTGLEITGSFFCDSFGKIHVSADVNLPELENTLLQ